LFEHAGYGAVWDFRIERQDAVGNRRPSVAVEMRGTHFEGSVADGDEVEVVPPGGWASGQLLVTPTIRNLTMNTSVTAHDPTIQAEPAESAATDDDGIPVAGVVEILRKDGSDTSKQALRLIEALTLQLKYLRFSAYLDSALELSVWLVGAAVVVAFGAAIGTGIGRSFDHSGIQLPVAPHANLAWFLLACILLFFAKGKVTARLTVKHTALRATVLLVVAGLVAGGAVTELRGHGDTVPNALPLLGLTVLAACVISVITFIHLYLITLTTQVSLTNGRVYKKFGILAKDSIAVDLWSVTNVELKKSFINRLTGDGDLQLAHGGGSYGGPPKREICSLRGVAHGADLEMLYQRLQDLRTVLRANNVVKGMVAI
jgi:hypothetical protein